MTITGKIGRSMPPSSRLLSKFKGCFLGGAIGDAMGMPVETFSRQKISEKFGTIDTVMARVTKHRVKDAGSVTDDTYLPMLTAQSIIERNSIDIDHITKKLIGGLEYPFGITGTTRKALELRAQGMDPAREIKGNRHGGCGAAVRMPPLAMFDINNINELLEHAVKVAQITHKDNDAVAGAVAVAFTIAWALRDELSPSVLLPKLNNMMVDLNSNLSFNFELVRQLLEKNVPALDGIEEIGTDAASVRLIPSALFAFLKYPNDYHTMITKCVNAGGDTDSRAAIAGFISGAYNGMDVLPRGWANRINMRSEVLDYSQTLYEMSVIGG